MADDKSVLDAPVPDAPRSVPRHEKAERPQRAEYAGGMPDAPEPVESSGKYRLLTQHLYDNQVLPPGTEVGTDTPYPWPGPPSNQMEGLDDASKAKVDDIHQKFYGRPAPWSKDGSIYSQLQADAELAKRQREEEEHSEPVSHQQAYERGHKEYRGSPTRPPQDRPSPLPTHVSGDRSVPLGPATPNQDPADKDVQTRPSKPLSESMPKEGAAGGGTQAPHKR